MKSFTFYRCRHAPRDGFLARSVRSTICVLLALPFAMAGCSPASSEQSGPKPMEVVVSKPVEREVTEYSDQTGRTAAVDSIEVRARVWGQLDKVNFKEGGLVKKTDVLFEIDPRSYQATLSQA